MAFAAALSAHPVSSHAIGEIVGQLLEAVGTDQDLVVVLATPGHRGALEDIVTAVRRLLSPGLILAAVTTGLGAGEEYLDRGPGLAAWSARCGPVAALDDEPGAPFQPVGALVLGTDASHYDLAGWRSRGLAVVAGAVDGPVVLDGTTPHERRAAGPGPVGVVFGPGSGFHAATVHGLRGLGPDLMVTRADGPMVYELDGQPALHRLFDVARDGMPAADLPRLAEGLHLRVSGAGAGPATAPLPVLGADRDNGAIALEGPVPVGAVVQFARADAGAVRAALGRSFGVVPDGALVLAPDGGGFSDRRRTYLQALFPPRFDDELAVDPPSALPASTLVSATHPPGAATAGSAPASLVAASVAYFTPSAHAG